jgi:hypothetical protein
MTLCICVTEGPRMDEVSIEWDGVPVLVDFVGIESLESINPISEYMRDLR